jgi:hypothetical protein
VVDLHARATIATLTARQVVLQRHHQETMAAAAAIYHQSRLGQARRRVEAERRQGGSPGPLAWFAVEGLIGEQVVRAVWTDGQLSCDRLLASRARLLVDLGVEFSCQDPPHRFLASLQAPPVAVLLTVMRACDLATVIDIDDEASPSLGMGS